MIKRENYINIQGWMLTDLGLNGNELIIYAIIYGFSQDEENKFEGSVNYLVAWTNSSRQTVMNNLKSLVNKGLIVKEEIYKNGVKFCKYFTRGQKILQGGSKNLTGGSQKILPNNINNNIDNNIDIQIENYFNEFWEKYPRKVNKKKTKDKFIHLLAKEKIDYSLIDKGLNNYIKQIKDKCTAPEYIAHPTTWLNGARWEDDYGTKEKPYNPYL